MTGRGIRGPESMPGQGVASLAVIQARRQVETDELARRLV